MTFGKKTMIDTGNGSCVDAILNEEQSHRLELADLLQRAGILAPGSPLEYYEGALIESSQTFYTDIVREVLCDKCIPHGRLNGYKVDGIEIKHCPFCGRDLKEDRLIKVTKEEEGEYLYGY